MNNTYNNIIIEFKPQTTFRDWIFKEIRYDKNKKLESFSQIQIEELLEKVLNKIPTIIFNTMEKLDWKIIVTNTRDLEKECDSNIKIFGYTNFDTQTIFVYANEDGIKSLPHEIAHFVDYLLNISNTRDWEYVCEKDKNNFEYANAYFTNTNEKTECFADAFMLFVLNKDILKNNTTYAYNVMSHLFEYMDYIITEDTVEHIKTMQENKMNELLEKLSNNSIFSNHCNYL